MSEHDGYRLSVRFGEEILARGHTAIPNLVLNYYVPLGLTGPELLFTIHVWQHWWSDRDPYPSLRTIATRMGISVRQAKRYVESLESKGFLRVVERFLPDGSQTTNEFDYSPLIRAIVKAARADGALEPSAAPTIVRRTRSRPNPGDRSDTPPPGQRRHSGRWRRCHPGQRHACHWPPVGDVTQRRPSPWRPNANRRGGGW